jgi:hypothetical protein
MTDRIPLDAMTSDQLDQLHDEIDRLRAGEEPGWDPLTVPTPGQWIARWNRATAAERLDVAQRVIANNDRASRCFEMNHEKRIEQAEELLRIAHDTSNKSETERACAVQRAETAERDAGIYRNRLARLTDGYAAQFRQLDRIRDAARLHRQQLIGTSELYAVIEALDEPAPGTAATRATDGTACAAYQPPNTPQDSGLCARCGMYDYKHTRQAADELGIDPVDPVDQYRRIRIELEHWQTVIVPDIKKQRDQLAAALSEILLAFSPVSSHNGVRIGWTAQHPIHPDDYDRWTAALPKETPDV